jgi:hypothetical protein
VTVQTLRRWERTGQLLPDKKTEGGTRYYNIDRLLGCTTSKESRKRLAETIIKEGVFTGFNTFAWTIAGAMLSPMNGKSSGEGLGALAGAVSGIGLGIAKSREDTRRIEDDKKVSTLTMIKGAVLGAGFAAGLVGVYEDPLTVIVGITAGAVLGTGVAYSAEKWGPRCKLGNSDQEPLIQQRTW